MTSSPPTLWVSEVAAILPLSALLEVPPKLHVIELASGVPL